MSENEITDNVSSLPRAASNQGRVISSPSEPQACCAEEISVAMSWKLVQPTVVWYRITHSMSAGEVDQARSKLSPDERARCDKFVFERDRRDFAAAHALLRDVLSHHGQLPPESWIFGSEADGKPYLADQTDLQFSLAHTDGLVACALSLAGPVGVDVEPVDRERDIDGISENYFALTEKADLRACNDLARRRAHFIELWTLKEAYLKALGVGLRRPLDEVAFRFPRVSDILVGSEGGLIETDWRFSLFSLPGDYRLAVAAHAKSSVRIFAREWPEKPEQPALSPIRRSQ